MAYLTKGAPRTALCLGLALFGSACGASQVQVIGGGPNDPGYPDREPRQARSNGHAHNDSTIELPGDEQIVEPDHPAVGTAQERALVHIHTPTAVCSGVVVGPRLILTAHQCVAVEGKGAIAIPADKPYRVEVASSTLTWTNRLVTAVVVPACDWMKLDVAVLVLKDPVPADAITPMRVASTPGPGGGIQALGFGRCAGEKRNLSHRSGAVVSSESDAIVIDVALCKGDVGGPVVESAGGDLVGVISHQDDPDDSPRHTTTIMRFDTGVARSLLEQANAVVRGGTVTKQAPIACE